MPTSPLKPALEFFDVSSLPRTSVAGIPGLFERILSGDPDTGDYTRCLYLEPGCDTSAMGVQRHEFWEEVWIISGSFHDISLDQTFSAGMYACRPPGMPHGPWRTREGCSTFEIRYHKR